MEYVNQGNAHIKVFGVGGGGSNAVDCMIKDGIGLEAISFICANTDAQALQRCAAPIKIQIGTNITQGLGAGANPEVGERSALEDQDRIREVLSGADMVFITAGMGGGTGTGAAPIVAQIAKDLGILTVAVVTKPLKIEGKKRMASADRGIQELRNHVDSLIEIPNQRLLGQSERGMGLQLTFAIANKVLIDAVRGITEIINDNGIINVDFADVRTIMSNQGSPSALMGTGIGRGEKRAISAAAAAISSPLLDHDIRSARALLMNFTGGLSMSLDEIHDAADTITREIDGEPQVILGAVVDESGAFDDETIKVTVIATGFTESINDEEHERTLSFDASGGTPYGARAKSFRPSGRPAPQRSVNAMTSYEEASYRSTSMSSAPPVHRDHNSSSSDEHPAWQIDQSKPAHSGPQRQAVTPSYQNRGQSPVQAPPQQRSVDRPARANYPEAHRSTLDRGGEVGYASTPMGQANQPKADYTPYGHTSQRSPHEEIHNQSHRAPSVSSGEYGLTSAQSTPQARAARTSRAQRGSLSSLMPVAPMSGTEDQWGSESAQRGGASTHGRREPERAPPHTHSHSIEREGTQDYDSAGYTPNGLRVYRS